MERQQEVALGRSMERFYCKPKFDISLFDRVRKWHCIQEPVNADSLSKFGLKVLEAFCNSKSAFPVFGFLLKTDKADNHPFTSLLCRAGIEH